MKFAFKKNKASILDKIICWWDEGTYSHVESILEENADGTVTLASSYPGVGVRTLLNQKLDPLVWDIVDVPSASVASSIVWFTLHNGEPYYFFGLFGFVFRPIVRGSRRRWFCSDACLRAAFNMHGSWRFSPNAMHDMVSSLTK